MKASATSTIFFFGATALAAPARPYYPSGSGSPFEYTTLTAAYPTGTAGSSPYSDTPYQTQATPSYYSPDGPSYNSIAIYPTGGIYPSGSYGTGVYLSGVYPTGSYAHGTTEIGPTETMYYAVPTTTVLPEIQVQWRKDTPRAKGNTPFGEINKRNGMEDINTAVRFYLSEEEADSKTCRLAFRLSSNGDGHIQFVGKPEHRSSFDLYELYGKLTTRNSWANRLQRGQKVGKFTPRYEDDAEYQVPRPQMMEFPCHAGYYSYEMVPHGSDAKINWKTTSEIRNGLVMKVY